MAQLPLDQAVERFKADTAKINGFANNPETMDGYTASDGTPVESVRKFLFRKNAEINGAGNIILSGAQAAAATATTQAGIATAAATTATTQAGVATSAAATATTQAGIATSQAATAAAQASIATAQATIATDAAASAIAVGWPPCVLATVTNDTLTGLAARDGVTPVAGDRALVRAQTAGQANGIYIAASGAWVRSSDADQTSEFVVGRRTYIIGGTANGGKSYSNRTNAPVIGTTAIVFSAAISADSLTVDAGLTVTAGATSVQAVTATTIAATTVAASGSGTAADNTLSIASAGNGFFAPAANALGMSTNGVERMRIDSTGNHSRVIPGAAVLYPDFCARAWAYFNGNNGTIRASGGITSVTRNGVGQYTVNFNFTMPDTNYATLAGARATAGGNTAANSGSSANAYPSSTTQAVLGVSDNNADTLTDFDAVHFLAIR